jgi:putative membrane protein
MSSKMSRSERHQSQNKKEYVMKLTIALAAACALLTAPAFAQSPNVSPTTGTPTSKTISTHDFVSQVAMDGMFDVQSARMAEQKGDSNAKTFAQREITDHGKAMNDLKKLVMTGKVNANIPTGLDGEYQQKVDALSKLSGKQFDTAYGKDQVQSHRNEIALIEQYARGGDNADLKHWASTNLPDLREHLNRAEKVA